VRCQKFTPNKVLHFAGGVTVLALERKDGTVLPCYLDTKDYNKVKKYRWSASPTHHKTTFYAVALRRGSKHMIAMHMLLAGKKGFDHKNRNGLDNRRHNLRPANLSQQAGNQNTSSRNTSGYRGVTRRKYKHQTSWQATIMVNGKRTFLGSFTTARSAALAYDTVALRLRGEFAVSQVCTARSASRKQSGGELGGTHGSDTGVYQTRSRSSWA
jgi:hypothetical protein